MSYLPKNTISMYIIAFATFLAFMGIGVVDPILPIIAKQLGAKHWEIEMLFTAYIFTMAFIMIPAGLAANRFGEKPVMTTGLFLVSVASHVMRIIQFHSGVVPISRRLGLQQCTFFCHCNDNHHCFCAQYQYGNRTLRSRRGTGYGSRPFVRGYAR
ncbi:hypothetical protein SRRS_06130 [Sporomusa rhizae]